MHSKARHTHMVLNTTPQSNRHDYIFLLVHTTHSILEHEAIGYMYNNGEFNLTAHSTHIYMREHWENYCRTLYIRNTWMYVSNERKKKDKSWKTKKKKQQQKKEKKELLYLHSFSSKTYWRCWLICIEVIWWMLLPQLSHLIIYFTLFVSCNCIRITDTQNERNTFYCLKMKKKFIHFFEICFFLSFFLQFTINRVSKLQSFY